jgi:hypothetical protein
VSLVVVVIRRIRCYEADKIDRHSRKRR